MEAIFIIITVQSVAIREYNMVRPGDKILVCLSGNRDSIALLHTMHQYQFYARSKGIHFSIGALFVHEPHSDIDPLHLMAYCRTLGVKLIYQDKINHEELQSPSLHRWSRRAVRRAVYGAAAAHGYGAAAVAQTLDRAAAAFLAGALRAGALRAVRAHYRVAQQDVRVVRPFIYVRARALEDFAHSRALPAFRRGRDAPGNRERDAKNILDRSVSVPSGSRKESLEREEHLSESLPELVDPLSAARELLNNQERLYPYIFTSLKSALHPLISAKNIEKERRHRKKSVIQMKNGAPVYDSEEGTEEEPVP